MTTTTNKDLTYTIILNGPPGSGKDQLAKMLIKEYENSGILAVHKEFKKRLYAIVMAIYGVDEETFFKIYYDREEKEKPNELFDGLSIRQAMIKTSEEVIKPVFGKTFFGDAAAKCLTPGAVNIFTDGGFNEEVNPVCFKSDKVLVVHMKRPGCGYESDSRRYIDPEKILYKNVSFTSIVNNGETLQDLEDDVSNFIYYNFNRILDITPIDKVFRFHDDE